MQYRPDAAELLDAIASLLEDDVIAAVPPHLQHQVRVSANLCRILQREALLAPTNDTAERERLAAVLGHDGPLLELRAELVARLDDAAPLDPDADRAIREALIATLRADLAIAKPGYDAATGAP
ncbi:MAG: DUF6285 domain-containing protein [Acidimicrobiales bacterium]